MKGYWFYHFTALLFLLSCNNNGEVGDPSDECPDYDFNVVLEFENSTDEQHQFTIYSYKRTSCLIGENVIDEIRQVTVAPNQTEEVSIPTIIYESDCNIRVCWNADPRNNSAMVSYPGLDCPGGGAGSCFTKYVKKESTIKIPIEYRPPCAEKNGHFYLDIINRLDTTVYLQLGNRRLEWFAGTGNAAIQCNEVMCCEFVQKLDPLDTFLFTTRENDYEILQYRITTASFEELDLNFTNEFYYTLYNAEVSKADSIVSVDVFGVEKDSIQVSVGGR